MISTILGELRTLAENAFPKICPSCGKRFENLEEFLAETEGLPGSSGLFESVDYNDKSLKDLLRNCTCGSTLLAVFKERRDLSPRGLKLRQTFENLMSLLDQSGIDGQTARHELLNILHHGSSELLEEHLHEHRIGEIRSLLAEEDEAED
ncbi:MAG: oxidoreductase [Verrucomicrobia bacterium]|nr:oxidoreductase [Verrucomicrobiota bacterium]